MPDTASSGSIDFADTDFEKGLQRYGENRSYAVNVMGTGFLLGALASMERELAEEGSERDTALPRRFIHCSSHDVSFGRSDRPVNAIAQPCGDLVLDSGCPYATSKARGEELVHRYFEKQIYPQEYMRDAVWKYVVIRPGHIVSPIKVFDDPVAREIYKTWPANPQIGNGAQMSMVSVDTLVQSLIQAAVRCVIDDAVAGKSFNVKDVDANFYKLYRDMIKRKSSSEAGSSEPFVLPVPVFLVYIIAMLMDYLGVLKVVFRRCVLKISGNRWLAYRVCPPRHPFLGLRPTAIHLTTRDFTSSDENSRKLLEYETNPDMDMQKSTKDAVASKKGL